MHITDSNDVRAEDAQTRYEACGPKKAHTVLTVDAGPIGPHETRRCDDCFLADLPFPRSVWLQLQPELRPEEETLQQSPEGKFERGMVVVVVVVARRRRRGHSKQNRGTRKHAPEAPEDDVDDDDDDDDGGGGAKEEEEAL